VRPNETLVACSSEFGDPFILKSPGHSSCAASVTGLVHFSPATRQDGAQLLVRENHGIDWSTAREDFSSIKGISAQERRPPEGRLPPSTKLHGALSGSPEGLWWH
jgi:hypothetical protein